MNILKKIAERILKQELTAAAAERQEMLKKIERQTQRIGELGRELAYLRRLERNGVIIPQTMVSKIISLLPEPNALAMGRVTTPALKKVEWGYYLSSIGERATAIRWIEYRVDEQDNKSVVISIDDFRITLEIPLIKMTAETNVLGVDTSVDTWVYNLSAPHIRLVADSDFLKIAEFIIAQTSVLKELSLP